jgi:hypothetical protein
VVRRAAVCFGVLRSVTCLKDALQMLQEETEGAEEA